MKKLLILGAGTAGTNQYSELTEGHPELVSGSESVSGSFSKTFEMLKRVQHEN